MHVLHACIMFFASFLLAAVVPATERGDDATNAPSARTISSSPSGLSARPPSPLRFSAP